MKVFATAFLTLLVHAAVNAQSNICTIKVAQEKKDKRVVFLAGGNGYELLERYLAEAKTSGVSVSPTSIEVKLWDGKVQKNYSISWGERLGGEPAMNIWKKKLSKVNAIYSEQELIKAHQMGWDILCVGQVTKKEEKKGECSVEAKSYISSGVNFVNAKQIDNAIKEFEYAVKISPSCPIAYANLVSAHVAKKNYAIAIEKFREGTEKAGEDPFLYITGVVAYINSKQPDKALETLEKVLTMKQKDEKKFGEVISFIESKDFDPLIKERKKEFCDLMLKYSIPHTKCR